MGISSHRPIAAILLSIAAIPSAFAQPPQIAAGGIVNAASGSSPLAPGGLFSIFGTNLAGDTLSAASPLPLTLGGTSVSVNGVPAPLSFVSPGQINAQVPSALATTTDIIGVPVVVTTSLGSSPSQLAGLAVGTPGIFSANAGGCGPAAALNINAQGGVSLNSPGNSAAPGDYIALFGTGFGIAAQQPPDGFAANGASGLLTVPSVYLDRNALPSLQYAGLAPAMVGVDQINFQIPASTRNGCSVPVSASQTFGSPSVTISVQKGGGKCADPPIQSWGQISLTKNVLSGFGPSPISFESFSASFPTGFSLPTPGFEELVLAPNYASSSNFIIGVIRSAVFISSHNCAVPGYSNLSAGAIQIQPSSGAPFTVPPQPIENEGVFYGQSLPDGYIVPGTYTVSGTPGNAVDLKATLVIGSPIQLQTPFPPGTVISNSQPLTMKWTGGDPGTLVRVSITSGDGSAARSLYTYADAAGGTLTISPRCVFLMCGFGLPESNNAQVTIQVMPARDPVQSLKLPGLTGPVQLTWAYTYNFSGLVLNP